MEINAVIFMTESFIPGVNRMNFWLLEADLCNVVVMSCVVIQRHDHRFPVVLYNTLYKVVIEFDCVHGKLKWDHSNMKATEQYFPVVLFVVYK